MTEYLEFPLDELGSVIVNTHLFPNPNNFDLCAMQIFNTLSEEACRISQSKNDEIHLTMLKSVRDQIEDAIANEVGFRTEFREAVANRLSDLIEDMETPKPSWLERLFRP